MRVEGNEGTRGARGNAAEEELFVYMGEWSRGGCVGIGCGTALNAARTRRGEWWWFE